MAATGSRTLRLLSLLQGRRYWPGAELAGRLGVSPRTVRRDVERLRELGYPVQATRGVDGGYQMAAGATLPPLVVDDDEAVALAVGMMQAAAAGGVAGSQEPALAALTKVVQVMPARLRRRVEALRTMSVPAVPVGPAPGSVLSPEVLIGLAQACRDTEQVEFTYTDRTGGATRRRAEPHRLVPMGRRWYLVAFDLGREDWRSFRVDRMSGQITRGGSRFHPRTLPAADAAAFVRTGIDDLPPRHRVEALVDAPGEQVRDRVGPWCTVTDRDGGTACTITMSTESLDWAAFTLGVIGARFTVTAPAELTDLLRDWGGRFTAAAGRGRVGSSRPRTPP